MNRFNRRRIKKQITKSSPQAITEAVIILACRQGLLTRLNLAWAIITKKHAKQGVE